MQAFFTAPGYKSDTMTITVDTATMTISSPASLGVGLQENGSVNLPYQAQTAVTVNLSSTNPAVCAWYGPITPWSPSAVMSSSRRAP